MNSFYGGPAGQSFEIRERFSTFKALIADINDGWKSSIAVGEYVMISYGQPENTDYERYVDIDKNNPDVIEDKRQNWNSTLWQKTYEEETVVDIDPETKAVYYAVDKSNTGINYKFISTCTGNIPRIEAGVVEQKDPGTEAEVEVDKTQKTYPDTAKLNFKLPGSWDFESGNVDITLLDVDQSDKAWAKLENVGSKGGDAWDQEKYPDGPAFKGRFTLGLPQAQNLQGAANVTLGVGDTPLARLVKEGEYDVVTGVDEKGQPVTEKRIASVNEPIIVVELPATQEFLSNNVIYKILNVGEEPSVTTTYEDGTHKHPILTFALPQAQNLLGVVNKTLDADGTPFLYLVKEGTYNVVVGINEDGTPITEEKTATVNEPIIIVELPQSQVTEQPETVITTPEISPSVEDIGTTNKPKLRFSLPRSVKFYHGDKLGSRSETTYTVTDESFTNYGVGDYYIHDTTGFIYKIISKPDDTTCVFEYQACVQSPLPSVDAKSMAPYIQGETGYVPATPQVQRYLTNNEGTEWELEFTLPQASIPAVTSTFVGSTEEGSVISEITDENTVTFNFKIPTGSKVFAGTEVAADGSAVAIAGSRIGDIYINVETGFIYTLTTEGWKVSEKSIKGPTGETLNIEASYLLTETETYEASLANGVAYIEEHYTETIDSHKIFSITWTLLNDGGEVAYWYFKTNTGEWSRVQLTGGVSSLIENNYKENVDNKTYSIDYINSLIVGKADESGKLITYSQAKIEELLETLKTTLETSIGSLSDRTTALETSVADILNITTWDSFKNLPQ